MEDGDQDSALDLAEQAGNLKPKTETATATLLDLQIKKQDGESRRDSQKVHQEPTCRQQQDGDDER